MTTAVGLLGEYSKVVDGGGKNERYPGCASKTVGAAADFAENQHHAAFWHQDEGASCGGAEEIIIYCHGVLIAAAARCYRA